MNTLSRVQVVLQATEVVELPVHPAAVLYATVAAAFGRSARGVEAMPDGVVVDVVEVGRLTVPPGESYHFGLTILGLGPATVADLLRELTEGLQKLGVARLPNRPVFGGNFQLLSILDLSTQQPFATTGFIRPLPSELFLAEIAAAQQHTRLTLHFTSPLRTARSKTAGHRRPDQEFFDRDYFQPSLFVNRVRGRALELCATVPEIDTIPTVVENRLIWLEVPYGSFTHQKRLAGAVGIVVLEGVSPSVAEILVLGQYGRVGESTRFGFGAYRILELGEEPLGPKRSRSLLELSFQGELDRLAAEADIPPLSMEAFRDDIVRGTYQPAPSTVVRIPKSGGERELHIPARRDRAIQKAIVAQIGPALDQYFEDSSWAYRKGLCRSRAAGAIQRAVKEGYQFAVRADFTSFFDHVNQVELLDRVQGYLGDATLTALVQCWLPPGGQGLPTGSPLSPVLANLYLDQFDERIAAWGGFLVRYADDFLILTRTESEARDLLLAAMEEAAQLSLTLNENKTQLLNLREPFTFLGFDFTPRTEGWEASGELNPLPLNDLGWTQTETKPPRLQYPLPGEETDATTQPEATLILGPERQSIRIEAGELHITYPIPPSPAAIPLQSFQDVLFLGPIAGQNDISEALLRQGKTLWFANDSGYP
ncbi:MAG: reverse transcriptase domain-containing protein, partial [Gemmataceae bacterium]